MMSHNPLFLHPNNHAYVERVRGMRTEVLEREARQFEHHCAVCRHSSHPCHCLGQWNHCQYSRIIVRHGQQRTHCFCSTAAEKETTTSLLTSTGIQNSKTRCGEYKFPPKGTVSIWRLQTSLGQHLQGGEANRGHGSGRHEFQRKGFQRHLTALCHRILSESTASHSPHLIIHVVDKK